jgi:FkbM family methyltransferase
MVVAYRALDVLKKIRSVEWVNVPVRTALRSIMRGERTLRTRVVPRWPVSGECDVRVGGVDMKLFGNCDDGLATLLFYEGQVTEDAELTLWRHLTPNARGILDVGAHTGIYAILAAKVSPDAKIVAFEPHPRNYGRMVKNLELNRAMNVVAEALAAGDSDRTISFTIPANERISLVSSAVGAFSRGHFGIEYKDVPVEQVSLDSYCRRTGLARVDLMKIDVEYYEANVLRGAKGILETSSPVVLMEVFNYDVFTGDKPELSEKISTEAVSEVESIMGGLGFHFYAIGKRGLLRVKDLRSIPDGGSNYLFSKMRLAKSYTPYRDAASLRQLLPRSN